MVAGRWGALVCRPSSGNGRAALQQICLLSQGLRPSPLAGRGWGSTPDPWGPLGCPPRGGEERLLLRPCLGRSHGERPQDLSHPLWQGGCLGGPEPGLGFFLGSPARAGAAVLGRALRCVGRPAHGSRLTVPESGVSSRKCLSCRWTGTSETPRSPLTALPVPTGEPDAVHPAQARG